MLKLNDIKKLTLEEFSQLLEEIGVKNIPDKKFNHIEIETDYTERMNDLALQFGANFIYEDNKFFLMNWGCNDCEYEKVETRIRFDWNFMIKTLSSHYKIKPTIRKMMKIEIQDIEEKTFRCLCTDYLVHDFIYNHEKKIGYMINEEEEKLNLT